MVYTSSYRDIDYKSFKDNVLSISGDRGCLVDYQGECYPALAPKREFWQKWHDNIGKISEEDNTKFYIERYYDEVLSKLDVNKVFGELDNKILLCYEDYRLFCHRQIVAAWFELYMGIIVPEVKQVGNELVTLPRRSFIKDYLEEVIKSRVDTRGFASLYSLNLFNKGEALEHNAQNNNDLELAKYLKNMAFDEEHEVRAKQYRY